MADFMLLFLECFWGSNSSSFTLSSSHYWEINSVAFAFLPPGLTETESLRCKITFTEVSVFFSSPSPTAASPQHEEVCNVITLSFIIILLMAFVRLIPQVWDWYLSEWQHNISMPFFSFPIKFTFIMWSKYFLWYSITVIYKLLLLASLTVAFSLQICSVEVGLNHTSKKPHSNAGSCISRYSTTVEH